MTETHTRGRCSLPGLSSIRHRRRSTNSSRTYPPPQTETGTSSDSHAILFERGWILRRRIPSTSPSWTHNTLRITIIPGSLMTTASSIGCTMLVSSPAIVVSCHSSSTTLVGSNSKHQQLPWHEQRGKGSFVRSDKPRTHNDQPGIWLLRIDDNAENNTTSSRTNDNSNKQITVITALVSSSSSSRSLPRCRSDGLLHCMLPRLGQRRSVGTHPARRRSVFLFGANSISTPTALCLRVQQYCDPMVGQVQ